MKRVLLCVFMVIVLTVRTCGIFAFAENNKISSEAQSTASQSTNTTAERTDDDPFAGNNLPTVKKTPTFYYILGGVAGVIIILAIAGFITTKNKK